MSIRNLIGYAVAGILISFGLLFAWAASVQMASTRLSIAFLMISAGILIIYLIQHKTREMVHRVELSRGFKASKIQCPSCSASLDISDMEIMSGIPMIKCRYCGNSLEVTEEPKW